MKKWYIFYALFVTQSTLAFHDEGPQGNQRLPNDEGLQGNQRQLNDERPPEYPVAAQLFNEEPPQEDFQFLDREREPGATEVALELFHELWGAIINAKRSACTYIKNINLHKHPTDQGIADTALRKLDALYWGYPIEAAKLGIHCAGIPHDKFIAYASENTTIELVRAISEGLPLTPQQKTTRRRRRDAIDYLHDKILEEQPPRSIDDTSRTLMALDIARQLQTEIGCIQLMPPSMLTAIKRKTVELTDAIDKLFNSIKEQNIQSMEQRQRQMELDIRIDRSREQNDQNNHNGHHNQNDQKE